MRGSATPGKVVTNLVHSGGWHQSRTRSASGAALAAAILFAGVLALAAPRVASAQQQGGSIFDEPRPGEPETVRLPPRGGQPKQNQGADPPPREKAPPEKPPVEKPPERDPPGGKAPGAAQRAPVPAEAEVAAARKAARTRFAPYYADRKTAVRVLLVKKLTEAAQAAEASPAERYALLCEAAEVAAAAGDVAAVRSASAEAARRFQADETELAVAALAAGQRGMNKDNAAVWAEFALKLADAASDAARHEVAAKAAAVADAAAKLMGRAGGAAVAARVKEKHAAVREMRAEEAKLKGAFEKLKTHPDDPDANARAGKFYCLISGDWERGLPALAKATQLELKTLAEMEAAALGQEKAGRELTVDARKSLGDGWWDLAGREREPYASRCKQRAAHHYRRALSVAEDADLKDRLWDRAAPQRPIDLLALVDPERDVLQGKPWERRGQELVCDAPGTNILAFPHKPAAEYDFLIDFTTAGAGEFRQFIPGSNAALIGWHLSSYDAGFLAYDNRNNKPPSLIPTGPVRGRHTSVIKVRKDVVRIYFDGKLAVEWKIKTAGLRGGWQIGKAALGVGCTGNTPITVHSALLIELPDEAPAAADAARGGRAPGT